MNLKEGMRRLALVAGVLGATVGAVGAYEGFLDTIAARARYKDFNSLAASGTVQDLRKAFYSGHMSLDCSEGDQKPWCKYQEQESVKVLGPDGKRYLFPPGTTKEMAIAYFKKKGITSGMKPGAEGTVESEQTPKWSDIRPLPGSTTLVNKGGIKSITWANSDFAIEKIETEDGRLLYDSVAPSFWTYLLHASWPILGFLVPWGAIRIIAWVLLGFRESPK